METGQQEKMFILIYAIFTQGFKTFFVSPAFRLCNLNHKPHQLLALRDKLMADAIKVCSFMVTDDVCF